MGKPSVNKSKFDKDHYWSGVFTGVFLGCFFVCLLLFVFIRFQGLKVAINPEQMAQLVQARIQNEAKRDIPQILEDIKKELPSEISNNLEDLENLSIHFGDTQVKLPEEVIAGIRAEFNRIIEEAIINTLNNYDTLTYEERIGKDVHGMVKNLLEQQIIGKTYIIKTSRWLSVPVKIVGSNEDQLQIGI